MGMFLNIKFGGDILKVDLRQVEREVDTYGAEVTRRAQLVLEEEGKNATGNLSLNIQHEVRYDENGNVSIAWPMATAPYWQFVEKGVRGAINDAKAPNSPFKFGSGSGPAGGLRPAIRQWINDKPISQWRDLTTGRFMSYDTMAKRISRKVYLYGIAPTPFLGPSIRELFANYKRRLERAYASDISIALGSWLEKRENKIFKLKF